MGLQYLNSFFKLLVPQLQIFLTLSSECTYYFARDMTTCELFTNVKL